MEILYCKIETSFMQRFRSSDSRTCDFTIRLLQFPQSSLCCLQVVRKAATRVLTGSKKRDQISLIQASLYWLSVKFRVYFTLNIIKYTISRRFNLDYADNHLIFPMNHLTLVSFNLNYIKIKQFRP